MCGLVAMIARKGGGFNYNDIKQLENLLIVDSTRGRDSTGVVNVRRDREVNFIKHANEPAVLFQSSYWEEFKKEVFQQGMITFGHNRAATRGAVSSENAHPFIEDNIILIHNGTLSGHANLTTEKVDVDSHAICHALRESEDTEAVLKKINGAFALIWWDTKKDKLFAIRNNERPLVLTITDDFYILSSEPWMAWGTSMQVNRKINEARQLNVGELISFEVGGKLESVQLDLSKPIVPSTYYSGGNRQVRNAHACGWESDYDTDNENFDKAARDIANLSRVKEIGGTTASTGSNNSSKTSTDSNGTSKTTDTESLEIGMKDSKAALLTAKNAQDTDEPFVRNLLIGGVMNHKYFKPQTQIEFRVIELSRMPSGRVRFTGKVSERDKPLTDVTGLMPTGFEIIKDGMQAYNRPWYGRVLSVRDQICGLTILVTNVYKPATIELHAGTEVAMQVWQHIKVNCPCRKCGNNILEGDKYVTHILTPKVMESDCDQPINRLEVTCATCIEQNIPKGELLESFIEAKAKGWKEFNDFNARKNAAIQAGKSVSKESGGSSTTLTVVPGSETVH